MKTGTANGLSSPIAAMRPVPLPFPRPASPQARGVQAVGATAATAYCRADGEDAALDSIAGGMNGGANIRDRGGGGMNGLRARMTRGTIGVLGGAGDTP